MIIDTEKTNCANCQFYQEYKTPQEVLDVLANLGKLMACNVVKGFGIVGPTFYCTKHEYSKFKGSK